MLPRLNPFEYFTDTNGDPLDGGYVYIGTANQNPKTSPITVYFDSAMTIPAPQPLRTTAGRIVRNGSPAAIYSNAATFSILIENKKGQQIAYTAEAESDPASNMLALADSSGSSLIGFMQSGTGAVHQTAQSKMRESVSVLDFGAVGDGVTNDASAFQAAHDAAAARGGGCVIVPPGATYVLSSGLTWDMAKVSLDGGGALFDFSGMASGVGFTLKSTTAGDPSISQVRNSAHCLENFWMKGPGAAVTTWKAFSVNDTVTLPVGSYSGFTIRQGGLYNAWKGFHYENGAFCIAIEDWSFNSSAAGGSGTRVAYPIHIDAGTNAGERLSLTNVFIGDATIGIKVDNANAALHCHNCSIDYSDQMFNITAGQVFFSNGHLESDRDVNYWGDVGPDDQAGLYIINSTKLVVSGNRSSWELFRSQNTVGRGGVILRDPVFITGGNSYSLQHLINGTGRASMSGAQIQRSGAWYPATSAYANVWPYGGTFEDANSMTGVTLAGATLPTRDGGGNARTGTYCLKIAPTTSASHTASFTATCKPGDAVAASLWGKWVVAGTAASAYVRLAFVDSAGNIISYTDFASASDQVTYTRISLAIPYPAPAGCVSVRLELSMFGRTSGTPSVYFDDVTFSIQ